MHRLLGTTLWDSRSWRRQVSKSVVHLSYDSAAEGNVTRGQTRPRLATYSGEAGAKWTTEETTLFGCVRSCRYIIHHEKKLELQPRRISWQFESPFVTWKIPFRPERGNNKNMRRIFLRLVKSRICSPQFTRRKEKNWIRKTLGDSFEFPCATRPRAEKHLCIFKTSPGKRPQSFFYSQHNFIFILFSGKLKPKRKLENLIVWKIEKVLESKAL